MIRETGSLGVGTVDLMRVTASISISWYSRATGHNPAITSARTVWLPSSNSRRMGMAICSRFTARSASAELPGLRPTMAAKAQIAAVRTSGTGSLSKRCNMAILQEMAAARPSGSPKQHLASARHSHCRSVASSVVSKLAIDWINPA